MSASLAVPVDTNLLVSYLLTHRPPIATLVDHYLAQDHFVLVTTPELSVNVGGMSDITDVNG